MFHLESAIMFWQSEAFFWQAVAAQRQFTIGSLSSQLSSTKEDLDRTVASRDAIQAQLSQAQAELTTARTEIITANTEFEEAQRSSGQVISDVDTQILQSQASLRARSETLVLDLNRTISDWEQQITEADTRISGIDDRTGTIEEQLAGTLTTEERNLLLEEKARIGIQNEFDKTERQGNVFTIASLSQQRDSAQAAATDFLDRIQGTALEPNFLSATDLNDFAAELGDAISGLEAAQRELEDNFAAERALRIQADNDLTILNIEHTQLQQDFDAGVITIDELETRQAELEEERTALKIERGIRDTRDLEEDLGRKIDIEFDLPEFDFEKQPDIRPPVGQLDPTSLSVGAALGQPSVPIPQVVAPQQQEQAEQFLGAPDVAPVIGTLSKASTVGDLLKQKNQQKQSTNVFG